MPANDMDGAAHDGDRYNSDVDPRTPLLKRVMPKPALLSHKISLLLQDWWLWEILSAIVAILATTVIILILVLYDNSSLPDWPSVFTLNSVISFFAVIAKLAITSAAGASISQSKWLWYRQDEPRPLKDLQLFDDASRGPWGAMTLLFSVRTRHLTAIGAIATILMLLFDPFLQQVVVYPDRLVPSSKAAALARAQQYQARSEEGLPLPSVVDMSMKAAIYNGIFDVRDQADVNVQHYCSTGNCTWQDLSSLAVCSKCVNITSYVEKSCNASGCYELSLPGGPILTGFGCQINSSVTNISSDLRDIEASVVQFSSLISKRVNDSSDAFAWECALSYCVNRYSTSVTDGVVHQQAKETWRNNSATHSQDSDLLYKPPSSLNGIMANASTFRVASLAAKAMNSFMSKTFTGSGGIDTSSTGSAFSSDVIHALYDTKDYSKRVENLAISMTNNIRQQNDSGLSPFSGVAFKTETYVNVRWAWFSYPATVLVLSLLYLIGTIIETTRRDVAIWKSSNLAMLFHGKTMALEKAKSIAVNKISLMDEMATGIEIELLQTDKQDWKLVQRSSA